MPELNKARYLAMKLSVELGSTMHESHPEVAKGFTQGYSQAELASHLVRFPPYRDYGKSVIEHAVRYSLIGNTDRKLGSVYPGSLSKDVYDIHVKRHLHDNGRALRLKEKAERRGIHGLDRKVLHDNAIKAAISRGEMPWKREEFSDVLSFALLEMFKLNGHVEYGSIARIINDKYYGGREVRTRVAVREALRRLQRSFSKDNSSEQNVDRD